MKLPCIGLVSLSFLLKPSPLILVLFPFQPSVEYLLRETEIETLNMLVKLMADIGDSRLEKGIKDPL